MDTTAALAQITTDTALVAGFGSAILVVWTVAKMFGYAKFAGS